MASAATATAIHPTALVDPGARLGSGVEIGPYAVIGPNCLLENDVRLEHSLVLRNTFLGRHLDVRSKIVEGGTLLDFLSGTRVELTDKFIASALAPDPKRAPGEEGFMTAWGRNLVRLCQRRPARSAA